MILRTAFLVVKEFVSWIVMGVAIQEMTFRQIMALVKKSEGDMDFFILLVEQWFKEKGDE